MPQTFIGYQRFKILFGVGAINNNQQSSKPTSFFITSDIQCDDYCADNLQSVLNRFQIPFTIKALIKYEHYMSQIQKFLGAIAVFYVRVEVDHMTFIKQFQGLLKSVAVLYDLADQSYKKKMDKYKQAVLSGKVYNIKIFAAEGEPIELILNEEKIK